MQFQTHPTPMRINQSATLFLTLITFSACTSPNSTPGISTTVIEGAVVYDGTGAEPIENSVIVIRDDMIDCVGEAGDCEIPSNAERIVANGKFITPGLVDAHIHFAQTGFFDSRPDAMDVNETYPYPEVAAYQRENPGRYFESYLCSGITAVYDVGGASWSVELQQEAEQNPMAPHVAAAGPLLTPVPGAPFDLPSDRILVQLDSEETGRTMVQFLSAMGSTGIKFWQINAADPDYMAKVEAVADEIRKQGNQMIAHATTLEQAKAALRNGTKLLVHSVSDMEVDDEFIELARENGTFYNPTMIVSAGYMLAYGAAADIEPIPYTDPNGCTDSKTLNLIESASQFSDHPRLTESLLERARAFNPETDMSSETMVQNLKAVYEAGIPVVVGTDAGNPGTLHGVSVYDEMEAMQAAGISPEDLIVMATKNGAESMRRGDDFGTLEAGKFGNLILLDRDPGEDISNMRSITHVMIKGTLKRVEDVQTH